MRVCFFRRSWYALAACTIGVAFVVSSRPATAQRPQNAAPADLIILNGAVYPGGGKTLQQAVAIRGNRIAAVGTNDEIGALRGPKTEAIDAGGAAVVPGFNDVHAHMLSGGLELDSVNLQGARSLDEIQSRIRTYAQGHTQLPWIHGRGWAYEPFPGGLPVREQLDAVVPDRPAMMRCFDGHSIWVNSKALAAAGITKDTPNPPNGTIVRDPKTGEPTGILKESPASALVLKVVPKPTRAEQRRALKAALDLALTFGVTSLTDAAGSPDDLEVYDEARRAGELSTRVYYSLLVTPGFTDKDADRFDAVWRAHPDTPRLKLGIIKMFMDGVIETNTAFMVAPLRQRSDHERKAQLHERGFRPHRADDGSPRLADHGARARRRRGADGARRIRACGGGESRAHPRPASSDRAHRDDRPVGRAAIRQAERDRVHASRWRLHPREPAPIDGHARVHAGRVGTQYRP